MTLTDTIAILGAITGVTGTVLGAIATVDLLRKNKVAIRLIPQLVWTSPHGARLSTQVPLSEAEMRAFGRFPDMFAIEIINLSAFPITICDVGLGPLSHHHRVAFLGPEVSNGYTWPPVIESRRAVTIYQSLAQITGKVSEVPTTVYARTECGTMKRARSKLLDQIAPIFHHRHTTSE